MAYVVPRVECNFHDFNKFPVFLLGSNISILEEEIMIRGGISYLDSLKSCLFLAPMKNDNNLHSDSAPETRLKLRYRQSRAHEESSEILPPLPVKKVFESSEAKMTHGTRRALASYCSVYVWIAKRQENRSNDRRL